MTSTITTSKDDMRARFHARMERDREYMEVTLPKIRREGEKALKELMPIAQGGTGQSTVVAKFLLGLYNGHRFPFDMTEFRRLDREVFEKCQAVLMMDAQPEREVHTYFEDGQRIFEELADIYYPRTNRNA